MSRDVFDILKDSREMKRVSWETLGREVGLTKAGIRSSINNKTLTLVRFQKICALLELNPAEIWAEESNVINDPVDPELAKSHLINQKLAAIARLTKEIQEELKY